MRLRLVGTLASLVLALGFVVGCDDEELAQLAADKGIDISVLKPVGQVGGGDMLQTRDQTRDQLQDGSCGTRDGDMTQTRQRAGGGGGEQAGDRLRLRDGSCGL